MAYDTRLERAPIGKLRLVAYTRSAGHEFLEKVGDYPTFAEALQESSRIGQENPDPDGKRRARQVFGIFDDKGYARWVQFPTHWSPNMWEGNRIWKPRLS
jgi:hypothetical protein